jgi:hypothetical protein
MNGDKETCCSLERVACHRQREACDCCVGQNKELKSPGPNVWLLQSPFAEGLGEAG